MEHTMHEFFTGVQINIWHFVTMIIGGILGHILTIRNDKRKEFNEIAAPLRARLLKELVDPNTFDVEIDAAEIDAIFWRLSRRKRNGFAEACARYKATQQQNKAVLNQTTGWFYRPNPEPIKKAVENILIFLKPK